jgi:hypothetical protein
MLQKTLRSPCLEKKIYKSANIPENPAVSGVPNFLSLLLPRIMVDECPATLMD